MQVVGQPTGTGRKQQSMQTVALLRRRPSLLLVDEENADATMEQQAHANGSPVEEVSILAVSQ